MAEVRTCVHFSVLFLCFQLAIGKPMFGAFWCYAICEDDDDTTTTTTESSEDYWDVLLCSGCDSNRPSTTQTPPTTLNLATANPMTAIPPSFNFIIPSGGMNMTMSQQSPGGGPLFSFIPWGTPQGAAPPVAPAVTTPAAPAATTVAAAATTAAAAATTAAGATTAAPTTAAPAAK